MMVVSLTRLRLLQCHTTMIPGSRAKSDQVSIADDDSVQVVQAATHHTRFSRKHITLASATDCPLVHWHLPALSWYYGSNTAALALQPTLPSRSPSTLDRIHTARCRW